VIHVPDRLQPYHAMIQAHCDVRRSATDLASLYAEMDPVWKVNRWTAQLLEQLLAEVRKRCPGVSLDQIRRADALAAGHTDWHRKLALGCAELAGS